MCARAYRLTEYKQAEEAHRAKRHFVRKASSLLKYTYIYAYIYVAVVDGPAVSPPTTTPDLLKP